VLTLLANFMAVHPDDSARCLLLGGGQFWSFKVSFYACGLAGFVFFLPRLAGAPPKMLAIRWGALYGQRGSRDCGGFALLANGNIKLVGSKNSREWPFVIVRHFGQDTCVSTAGIRP